MVDRATVAKRTQSDHPTLLRKRMHMKKPPRGGAGGGLFLALGANALCRFRYRLDVRVLVLLLAFDAERHLAIDERE